MKKFDIEKAKKGAAVCLRDGTPVKILDFDYKGNVLFKYTHEGPEGKPIYDLGLADNTGFGLSWRDGPDKDQDLFMTPMYGYMNVYKNETNTLLVGGVIRATHEECIEAGKAALNANLKWFCVARVELLEEEGGESC